MIELTEQQRQVLEASADFSMFDTNTQYVLVRKDILNRLKGILDADDARLMEPALATLDPEDWEDAANYDGKP